MLGIVAEGVGQDYSSDSHVFVHIKLRNLHLSHPQIFRVVKFYQCCPIWSYGPEILDKVYLVRKRYHLEFPGIRVEVSIL